MDSILYDMFAEELVCVNDLKNVEYAPPERYSVVRPGTTANFIEHWSGTKDGTFAYLSVIYTEEEYYDQHLHAEKITSKCKSNGFKPELLRDLIVPKETFDEWVKHYELNKSIEGEKE